MLLIITWMEFHPVASSLPVVPKLPPCFPPKSSFPLLSPTTGWSGGGPEEGAITRPLNGKEHQAAGSRPLNGPPGLLKGADPGSSRFPVCPVVSVSSHCPSLTSNPFLSCSAPSNIGTFSFLPLYQHCACQSLVIVLLLGKLLLESHHNIVQHIVQHEPQLLPHWITARSRSV